MLCMIIHQTYGILSIVIVANNSIQNAAVQYIYDSVLDELWKDSEKKFVSVEMEFFSHWWKEQTLHVKRKVHKVVERYIRK